MTSLSVGHIIMAVKRGFSEAPLLAFETSMGDLDYCSQLQFAYHPSQHQLFRQGKLGPQWAKRYPDIFDKDDWRLHRTQHGTYHFYEWLAAVLLRESTGYLCLIEKYTSLAHERKRKLLHRIVGSEVFDWIWEHDAWAPDLFVYSLDFSDWFFCEVEGNKDKLRIPQLKQFHQLYQKTGRKVCVLSLLPIRHQGQKK